MSLHFARLTVSVLALAHVSLQETKTCYACASESLSSRWHITGLPRVQDAMFGDCSSQSVAKMRVESCSGSCFTYMFEDPDIVSNSASNPVLLVVRGCHTSLTAVVSDRSDGAGGNFYCEYDATHQMSNSKGEMVSVRALAEFCSTTNCNTRQSTSPNVFTDCNDQATDYLINNEVLNCYECTTEEGKNCKNKERKCSSKKYCTKQIVKLGSGFQLSKSCSNINLLGADNSCANYELVTSPGGVAVRNKYSQCYCRNRQYCNSVSKPGVLIAIVTLTLSSLLLVKI